jgi:hypothetical protein
MRGQCECGWFLSDVRARVRIFAGEADGIDSVWGTCKRHGKVEALSDWAWEDFFPTDESVREFEQQLTVNTDSPTKLDKT